MPQRPNRNRARTSCLLVAVPVILMLGSIRPSHADGICDGSTGQAVQLMNRLLIANFCDWDCEPSEFADVGYFYGALARSGTRFRNNDLVSDCLVEVLDDVRRLVDQLATDDEATEAQIRETFNLALQIGSEGLPPETLLITNERVLGIDIDVAFEGFFGADPTRAEPPEAASDVIDYVFGGDPQEDEAQDGEPPRPEPPEDQPSPDITLADGPVPEDLHGRWHGVHAIAGDGTSASPDGWFLDFQSGTACFVQLYGLAEPGHCAFDEASRNLAIRLPDRPAITGQLLSDGPAFDLLDSEQTRLALERVSLAELLIGRWRVVSVRSEEEGWDYFIGLVLQLRADGVATWLDTGVPWVPWEADGARGWLLMGDGEGGTDTVAVTLTADDRDRLLMLSEGEQPATLVFERVHWGAR